MHPVPLYAAVYMLYIVTALRGTIAALCVPGVDPWAALLSTPTITVPGADHQSFLKMMGLSYLPSSRSRVGDASIPSFCGVRRVWVHWAVQEGALGRAMGAGTRKVL